MKFKRISRILIILGLILVFSTAFGAGLNNWSPPENLSGWHISVDEPHLLRASNGTQVVFWVRNDPILKQESLWARIRHPGSPWSTAANIFGWIDYSNFHPEFGITTNGIPWALWAMPDKAQVGDNLQVKAASWSGSDPWHIEVLSNHETDIRNINLAIGPDNHIAATWVACATSTSNDQGPCDVRVRRRNPGASTWEVRDESIDASIQGILYGRSLVGPGGLIVTTWAQHSIITPGQWHVMANSFNPNTKMWEFLPQDISNGEFQTHIWPFLFEPVMGADGTIIVAWYQQDPGDSSKAAIHTTTRQASTGTWNLPNYLSKIDEAGVFKAPKLAVGQNGTAVAAWVQRKSLSIFEDAVYANVRDPGGVWSSNPEQISQWMDNILIASPQVWPDGSSILVWEVTDDNRDSSEDESILYAARSPAGTWGDMGQGQLGNWVDWITRVTVAAAHDGSISVGWGVHDSTLPVDQREKLLTASWVPGSGPISIDTLTEGNREVELDKNALVVSEDGQTKAISWLIEKKVEHPSTDPAEGVFYSQAPPPTLAMYLPLITLQ